MRVAKARPNADVAQLKDELTGVVPPESVTKNNGDVLVTIPDEADGEKVDRTIRERHFPRSLMRDVVDAFNSVDYQTPTTVAALKVEFQKHLAADKLLARLVKTRIED